MNRHLPSLAAALALLAGATLQDVAAAQVEEVDKPTTTAAKAVATAMVLETTDLMVGSGFLGRFDPAAELPDISEKQHYVLTVTTDGKIRHATAEGDIGWMRSTIYPAALMQLYETPIEDNWEKISGGAIIGLTQIGMTTQDAARLMKAVKVFPRQIESLHLSLSTNPETQFKGLKITASIKPVKGTWLGNLARHLRPHAQGAPTLATKDPMMWIGVAIDPEGLNTFFAPAFELFANLGARNKKQREKNALLYTKVMNMQDGTFLSVGDPFGGGMRTVGGLRDGKSFRELLLSGEYERLMKVAEEISPNIETEFESVAFEHRDIKVAKTTVTTDMDTPLAPAGDQISYLAVAGDFLVSTSSLKPLETKKLIDMGLDQKIKRAPLPGNALMVMNIKLMELLDKIVPFGNPLEGKEDAPKMLHLVLDNKDGTLNASIHFK
jgi:hypothetical protein